MARRRNEPDDDISLFPFLSIIACVIGVLTLMISTLALSQMDNDVVASAEKHEQVKQQIEKVRADIAKIKQRIEQETSAADRAVSDQQQAMQSSREELERLQQQLADALKQQQQLAEIKIVIPTVPEDQRETIEDMNSQLQQLTEKLAQLEKEISERKLPPKESEVSILPSGSGQDFNPYFVECAAGAIVLHTALKPEQIRAAEMATNESFRKVLEKAANDAKGTVLFLVRSDGLGTYHAARRLADAAEVRNGKLPVVGKGRIDLSRFVKK